MSLIHLLDSVLAVTLAPACASCARPLDEPTRGPVCSACWGSISPITPPLCDRCGDALPSWRVISQDRGACARCRRSRPAIDRARALGRYDGALREIIHALKYGRRRTIAAPLGSLMARRCEDVLGGADLLVPVPLHRRRRRARGFNQARDLASGLGLPVVDVLARIRDTASQTDLPAARRHANVRHAFAVRTLTGRTWSIFNRSVAEAKVTVAGRCVVLVDDVCTTGATLEACARVLKAAGAREVRAITAARVWLPQPRQSPRPRSLSDGRHRPSANPAGWPDEDSSHARD
ncbi:MAG: ComF family protein [Acidobacteria bacterium]|nr:ComF family protein [Acidobacteriota bacterium]